MTGKAGVLPLRAATMGTVTNVAGANANGFTVNVTTPTTTPTITVGTSLTGLMVGNGTAATALAFPGGTTQFLRADGSFDTPAAGTGTVTSVDVSGGTTGLTTSGGPVTTSGTITLAGILTGANGGTGVANTGKTITIGGNVTYSGAFTFTGAVTANTSITYPTSGTLLSTAAAVTVPQGGTGLATLTANNLLVGAGTSNVTFIAPGTSGNVLTSNGSVWSSMAPASSSQPYIYVRDEKTSGTVGGSSTPGASAFTARVLNTTQANTVSGASLASNQVTLPAGTYQVSGRAPIYAGNAHKTRLQNITDTTTTIMGSNAYAPNSGDAETDSWVRGVFTIAGTKVFEFQYQCALGAPNGLGLATNFGTEIYAEIAFVKVA